LERPWRDDRCLKSQVSRLCEEIDVRVTAFLDRPIEGDWPYLWIHATYLKVRRGGRIVSVAVIIAIGFNTDAGARCSARRRRSQSGPSSCASSPVAACGASN